jgi:two-component system chemotaxis response regulator CheY
VTESVSRDAIKALLLECREKLDAVESDLIAFETGKVEASADFVTRVFLGLSSVKSAGGYLGHEPLAHLAKASETVLAQARDGRMAFSSAHSAILRTALDRMRQFLGDEPRPVIHFSAELESLNTILGQSPSPAALPDPPHLRRLKVLVVEDDFVSRVVLQGLLSKYGECHIAVNGREAVEAFRRALTAGEGYDLICLDVKMPEMDGPTALGLIREIEAGQSIDAAPAKVFMTTSVRDMKTVVGSFKLICDAYLLKPLDGKKLEDHLTAAGLISPEPVVA